MKDLLIVYGRNHYPEDIESTVQEITGGRVAAISVPVDQMEKLVTIIELKKRGDSDEDAMQRLGIVKNDVTAAISSSHGLNVADLVLVPPGSIPTTTSGKIRRAACVEQYRRRTVHPVGRLRPRRYPRCGSPSLVMAVAVSLEPFRIGMTVLMLNRPRPLLQLLAFLCGGFAMGLTVGRSSCSSSGASWGARRTSPCPRVQIVIGALALAVAAVLAAKIVADRLSGRDLAPPDDDCAGSGSLMTRTRRLLDGSSLWVAAAAGLGIALPSVDYLAALAVILASGAPVTTQVGALLMFNVIAFSLVEIPLVAYLLAPTATRAVMDRAAGLDPVAASCRGRRTAGGGRLCPDRARRGGPVSGGARSEGRAAASSFAARMSRPSSYGAVGWTRAARGS